ncbi:MAG: STAS/SEC14 domain-containing protein [Beijerinckiaceae bacterium]
MIDILTGFPDRVFGCRLSGRLHRADYEKSIIPAVEAAFAKHETLRVYCEIDGGISVDAGAAWDDFKLGMSHYTRWERMAVVTDAEWLARAIRFASVLVPGEFRIFGLKDRNNAQKWIVEGL